MLVTNINPVGGNIDHRCFITTVTVAVTAAVTATANVSIIARGAGDLLQKLSPRNLVAGGIDNGFAHDAFQVVFRLSQIGQSA